MTDARDSYFFAIAMMRLRALILGERWAQPEDEFDLARIIDRQREKRTA